jgi:hypothetical protein
MLQKMKAPQRKIAQHGNQVVICLLGGSHHLNEWTSELLSQQVYAHGLISVPGVLCRVTYTAVVLAGWN